MQLLLIVVVVIVFTPTTVYEKFGHIFMSEITSTLLSEAVMYRSWNPGSPQWQDVTNDGNCYTGLRSGL
jgi:hypothetical protein